jgi:hypothetical protein
MFNFLSQKGEMAAAAAAREGPISARHLFGARLIKPKTSVKDSG